MLPAQPPPVAAHLQLRVPATRRCPCWLGTRHSPDHLRRHRHCPWLQTSASGSSPTPCTVTTTQSAGPRCETVDAGLVAALLLQGNSPRCKVQCAGIRLLKPQPLPQKKAGSRAPKTGPPATAAPKPVDGRAHVSTARVIVRMRHRGISRRHVSGPYSPAPCPSATACRRSTRPPTAR